MKESKKVKRKNKKINYKKLGKIYISYKKRIHAELSKGIPGYYMVGVDDMPHRSPNYPKSEFNDFFSKHTIKEAMRVALVDLIRRERCFEKKIFLD